ncbi:MAG: hypothetical protein KC475_01475 [Cyanobacteria bacterium HKST-UBA03]|nr:hypothetical protein [Cyanobacteria bacterium HKST-UBA03]
MLTVEQMALSLARFTAVVFNAVWFALGVLTLVLLLLLGPKVLAADPPTTSPTKPAVATPSQAKPVAKGASGNTAAAAKPDVKPGTKPETKSETKPAAVTAPPTKLEGTPQPQATEPDPSASVARVKPVQPSIPALFELHAYEGIRNLDQPLTVEAQLRALQPITVCLDQEAPEQNLALDVWRQGYGQLASASSRPFQVSASAQQHPTDLQPGEMMTFKVNLRKAIDISDAEWVTGDYRFQGQFSLGCAGDALVVPIKAPLHLVLVEY